MTLTPSGLRHEGRVLDSLTIKTHSFTDEQRLATLFRVLNGVDTRLELFEAARFIELAQRQREYEAAKAALVDAPTGAE